MTIEHGPTRDEQEQQELWAVYGGGTPGYPLDAEPHTDHYNTKTPDTPAMPGMNGSGNLGNYDTEPTAKPFPPTAEQPVYATAYTSAANRQAEHKSLLGTPRRKLVALGGTAVLALGVTIGIVTAEHGDGHAAAAPAPVMPETPSAASPATAAPEQSSRASFAPTSIEAEIDKMGNIQLNQPLLGTKGYTEPWRQGTVYLPPLLKPNSQYGPDGKTTNTVDDTAREFLETYSYLLSSDPASKGYTETMDRLTDEPTVRTAITEQNRTLHGRYGAETQFILFDTAGNAVSAQQGGFNAAQQPTVVVPTSGKLYIRALRADCHMDYTDGTCTDDTTAPLATFDDSRAIASGDAAPLDIVFAWDPQDARDDGSSPIKLKSYQLTMDTGGNNAFYDAWFPIDIDSTKVTPATD